MASLNDYLQQLQNQISQETVTNPKYEVPQVVQEIISVRQLEAKVVDVQNVAEKLLNDLDGYEKLIRKVSGFLKEVRQQHSELFDSWTAQVTSQIENNSLRLQESDPVVKFSSSKLMIVNYSKQFITLTREVRQLSALGYRIPSNITEVNEHAKQFIKFAKILEQVIGNVFFVGC